MYVWGAYEAHSAAAEEAEEVTLPVTHLDSWLQGDLRHKEDWIKKKKKEQKR